MLGLLNREGVQVATAASAAENMDAIYRAQTAVFTKTGLRVDGLVVNPADYEEHRLWATAEDGERIPISIVCKRGSREDSGGGTRPVPTANSSAAPSPASSARTSTAGSRTSGANMFAASRS